MRFVVGILAVTSAACEMPVERPKLHMPPTLSVARSQTITESNVVSVSGYLTFGDDKHNLWASEKDYRYVREGFPPPGDPAWRRCIALADYGRFRSKLLKNDGKSVVVTGTLVRHVPDPDEINLGACSDVQISLGGAEAQVSVR